VLLIAEIGVNHNGRVENAFRLIDAAKESGADVVKFQFFKSKKLWGDDRIKHLELDFRAFEVLADYCKEINIEFCCTPFGVEEMLLLKPMLKRVKIASGMVRRKPFLDAVATAKLPILLSTGMSTMPEIESALGALTFDRHTDGDITVLQCTSSYPCRLEDVQLSAMVHLRGLGHPVGLSDHTTSITVPIAAAAMGAQVIEKHFTLDRKDEGPDHKASITPKEFRAMKLALIEIEAAMGSGGKRVLACEEALRKQWK